MSGKQGSYPGKRQTCGLPASDLCEPTITSNRSNEPWELRSRELWVLISEETVRPCLTRGNSTAGIQRDGKKNRFPALSSNQPHLCILSLGIWQKEFKESENSSYKTNNFPRRTPACQPGFELFIHLAQTKPSDSECGLFIHTILSVFVS